MISLSSWNILLHSINHVRQSNKILELKLHFTLALSPSSSSHSFKYLSFEIMLKLLQYPIRFTFNFLSSTLLFSRLLNSLKFNSLLYSSTLPFFLLPSPFSSSSLCFPNLIFRYLLFSSLLFISLLFSSLPFSSLLSSSMYELVSTARTVARMTSAGG